MFIYLFINTYYINKNIVIGTESHILLQSYYLLTAFTLYRRRHRYFNLIFITAPIGCSTEKESNCFFFQNECFYTCVTFRK